MKKTIITAFILLGALFGCTTVRAVKKTKVPALVVHNFDDWVKNKKDLENGKPEVTASYEKLLKTANALLKKTALKVTDGDVPPSGDKHDFYTIAKYAWPNPDKPDGMPYYTRDGIINPESGTDRYDLKRLDKTAFNVTYLVTAWFYSNDERYAAKAAELLRTWFINPETRMNPNFDYAAALPGVYNGTYSGVIYGVTWINMLDYVKILSLSKSWTKEDDFALQKWFSEYVKWLQTSEFGIKESKGTNNHVTYYCSQIAAFALYYGDLELAKTMVERGKELIAKQIAEDGSLPRETGRTKSFHYSLYGLKAFCWLADCGRVAGGADLWNYTAPNGRNLRLAFDFILPYILKEKEWTIYDIGDDNEKLRWSAIGYIREATKALNTDELKRTEQFITSIAPKDLDKVWLLGRNTEK